MRMIHKTICISLSLLLLLCAAACTPRNGRTGDTEAPLTTAAPEPVTEAPTSEPAYHLGTPLEFDPAMTGINEEWYYGDSVIQVISRYDSASGEDKVTAVYDYGDFITVGGEEEGTLFEEKYKLTCSIGPVGYISGSNDPQSQGGPYYVSDPAVFDAFKGLVLNLDFEETDAEWSSVMEDGCLNDHVRYSVETDGGGEGYRIFRSGDVVKDDGTVSKEKLTGEETAYFFAAAIAYAANDFGYIKYPFDRGNEEKTLEVSYNGREIALDHAKSVELLEMISDEPDVFLCWAGGGVSAGYEEAGEKLIGFFPGGNSAFRYYICSNGAVLVERFAVTKLNWNMADSTGYYYDTLYIKSYSLSDARFDVSAITALLDGAE